MQAFGSLVYSPANWESEERGISPSFCSSGDFDGYCWDMVSDISSSLLF